MAFTAQEEAKLKVIVAREIKTDARDVARKVRDARIAVAQGIYTTERNAADVEYTSTIDGLDAEK